jgi:hypothetical protein
MLAAVRSQQKLPLFHLYGEPPDDQAFDFIHIETIPSRSIRYGWIIDAHRHRNLFQILVIERGGGEMMHDATTISLNARLRQYWSHQTSRTPIASFPSSQMVGS